MFKAIWFFIMRLIHILLWGKHIQKTDSGMKIHFSKTIIEMDGKQTIIHFNGRKNVGHINRVLSQQEIQNLSQDGIRQWLNKGRNV